MPGQLVQQAKACGKLDTDGYAHHAYTTAKGPRFVPLDRRDVTLGVLSRLERALDRAGKAGAVARGLPVYLTEFGIQSQPDRIQGVSFAKQAAYLAIAEHMAYVNPRVRSFSQYLMADDRPRRSALNRYAGFESGLRPTKGPKKPAYKAFRLPLAVENYGRSDVLWGLVRPSGRRPPSDRGRPEGQEGLAQARDVKTTGTGVYSLRATHREGQRYRVKWTAPGGTRFPAPPSAPTEPAWTIRRAWPFVRLGSGPDGPTMGGRRSSSTMRTLRMHLLGLEVADVNGRTLGQVVDTYPFDGGGELEMVVLRLRRFGERRMLPVSELRMDDGRLVVPFTRHQVEDSPGLSTGRHADEDPWRAKTYWYYEDHAVARARRARS